MNIIVINCGSSSIKYQLFNMTKNEVIAKGLVDKIGLHGSYINHEKSDGDTVRLEGEIVDHQAGIEYMLGILISRKRGSIKSFDEIDAVGHRVVHGGEKFHSSVLIDEEVLSGIQDCVDLAPLHNPPNLKGIYAMQSLLPNVPQVATFDTAFHQTMPDYTYMYAIPYSLYTKYGIRRYGFHGSSHRFVSGRAARILDTYLKKLKLITCHLGNGASMTAIKDGGSLDTSMGLTPVEGLIMGTRTGDLDLGVLTYLMSKEEIGVQAANTLINKHSGMVGISGISSDMREIEKAAFVDNDDRASLALKMYHYRIKKYIGAYMAAMGGADAIVFTGGIGENSPDSREEICRGMEFAGIHMDLEKNASCRGMEAIISKDDSPVKLLVIPTNEELVIAEDTARIIAQIK